MASDIQFRGEEWLYRELPLAGDAQSTVRRGEPAAADLPPGLVETEALEVVSVYELTLRPRRRWTPPVVGFSLKSEEGGAYAAILRHPSGAFTLHAADELEDDFTKFEIEVPSTSALPNRRGWFTKAVKLIVVKVVKAAVDKAADWVLDKLGQAAEAKIWKKLGRSEGLLRVDRAALSGGALPRVALDAPPPGRSLLLVHGTFSTTSDAFKGLAESDDFWRTVSSRYGGRVYGFDHFSVSRTPEENVQMLLDSLPPGFYQFDAISHSRGGLVLRTLIDRHREFSSDHRIDVARAVLVASPNEGTPLATPKRWEQTLGWYANLAEVLPDNPFTTATGFLADAAVWIANRVAGSLPGLAAMDANGDFVRDLQAAPPKTNTRYAALASNYAPAGNLLARIADVGLDAFFQGANDLVVPTEGGWHLGSGVIADPIGAFGAGGNLAAAEGATHVGLFGLPATGRFIADTLEGRPAGLTAIDPYAALPWGLRRSAIGGAEGSATATRSPVTAEPRLSFAPAGDGKASSESFADTLELTLLRADVPDPPDDDEDDDDPGERGKKKRVHAHILASYRGARVVETFRLGGRLNDAGKRWQRIIAEEKRLKKYFAGEAPLSLSSRSDLVRFGQDLFDTLFPGKIRRLYDDARGQESGRLNVVFASQIPWVAAIPWEFAFDPNRNRFLCTEEVHFVRNVISAVPADRIPDLEGRLRILVVVAQPIGTVPLSAAEETKLIRRGFRQLEEAGLAEVEVLPKATPSSLHARLLSGGVDVLHFIGHGRYDQASATGFLLFEDSTGHASQVDDQALRELVCGRGIRLVFLNACETGRGGRAEFNDGTAPALASSGMPAVVANQFPVLDPSAATFARQFYWSLARGVGLGEAAREARIAVNYSYGDAIDWAIPVLYTRAPQQGIAKAPLSEAAGPVVPAITPEPIRRSSEVVAVGLWDVSNQFPALDALARQLNAAQSVFHFQVVDLAAPAGTLERFESEGVWYFNADQALARLGNMVNQLGLDALYCITGLWLSSKAGRNFYTWWPEDSDPPVYFYSSAGLDLPRSSPVTDRALAAGFVSAYGCHKGQLETESTYPSDCAFYFDTYREAAGKATQISAKPMEALKGSLGERVTLALTQILESVAGDGQAARPTLPNVKERPEAKRKQKSGSTP